MTIKVKLSSKNQIVIPHSIRRQYHIRPGQKLLVSADEYGIYLMPEPKNWVAYAQGSGKKMWQKLGGGETQIRKLRKEWDEHQRV